MDRKLQKVILEIIRSNDGIAEWQHLKNKVIQNYHRKLGIKENKQTSTIIKHQLDLLIGDNKVIRKDELPSIYYILTKKGHEEIGPWCNKTWNFVLYDKHNLFIILSLIISFFALFFSLTSKPVEDFCDEKEGSIQDLAILNDSVCP